MDLFRPAVGDGVVTRRSAVTIERRSPDLVPPLSLWRSVLCGPRVAGDGSSGLPDLLALGSGREGEWGGRVAVGDGHVLVHRSRGFDAFVGGAPRLDAGRLARDDEVVGPAIGAHGGYVIKTRGEGSLSRLRVVSR